MRKLFESRGAWYLIFGPQVAHKWK
ncbi:hypothetical protein SGPA1_50148 [Streptomyces misionensis JCM 4497]